MCPARGTTTSRASGMTAAARSRQSGGVIASSAPTTRSAGIAARRMPSVVSGRAPRSPSAPTIVSTGWAAIMARSASSIVLRLAVGGASGGASSRGTIASARIPWPSRRTFAARSPRAARASGVSASSFVSTSTIPCTRDGCLIATCCAA